jgi:hypothetical protein
MAEIAVPEALQAQVDALIAAHYDGRTDPVAFEKIQEYLEGDGWDELYTGLNDLLAVNFSSFTGEYLDDSQLRAYVGLDDDEPLSPSDRIEFARERLSVLLEELDDVVTPSIVHCTLKDTRGRAVVVGGYTESHGQAGPFTTWLKVVGSEAEFFQLLKDQDLIVFEDVESISDEKILSAWQR